MEVPSGTQCDLPCGSESEHFSTSCISSATDSSSDADQCANQLIASPLRKKNRQEYARLYYRRLFPFRRVQNNDIRRYMGAMWVNVMNGGNPHQMLSFLEQFASKDFVQPNVFLIPKELRESFPTAQDRNSCFDTVLHWAYISSMLPDITCTVLESQIIQCKGAVGSIIRVAVRYEGNVTFQLQSPYASAVQTLQSAWVYDTDSRTSPVLDLSKLQSLLSRAPPLHMISVGAFLLHLNAENFITLMEYQWKEVTMTSSPL